MQSQRVIDVVPMMLDGFFVRALSDELQSFLIMKLGLGTADATARCEGYLAEDPNVVVKRAELAARKVRLESAIEELDRFGI